MYLSDHRIQVCSAFFGVALTWGKGAVFLSVPSNDVLSLFAKASKNITSYVEEFSGKHWLFSPKEKDAKDKADELLQLTLTQFPLHR